MGQYHVVVNLSRREYLSGHTFGDGIKLMEFGQSGFRTMFALGYLLENDWKGDVIAIAGDYQEDGDFSPELLETLEIDPGKDTIYSIASGGGDPKFFKIYKDGEATDEIDTVALETSRTFTDVSKRTISAIESADIAIWGKMKNEWSECFTKINYSKSSGLTVIVNQDTKEVIDPRAFGDVSKTLRFAASYFGGTMTALAVLLASGCKGGGRGGGDIHSESELVGSWSGSHIAIVPRAEMSDYNDISADIRTVLTETGEGKYEIASNGKVKRVNPW